MEMRKKYGISGIGHNGKHNYLVVHAIQPQSAKDYALQHFKKSIVTDLGYR